MIKTGQPLTSILRRNEATETVIADYRFRVSENGNQIVILSNDPLYTSDYSSNLEFLVYDLENQTTHKTSVPMTDNRVGRSDVVDFLLGQNNNLYLLERRLTKEGTSIDKLRYIEAGGETIWQTEAQVGTGNPEQRGSIFGKTTALLKEANGAVFLQTESSTRTLVLKVDSKTGNAEEFLSADNIVPTVFIGDDLALHYVTFIKEANNRAYISYSGKGEKEIRYAGAGAYALLGFPAALDNHNNIYCADGLTFSCLSPDLLVKWTFSVNSIVLDSGRLLTSHFNETDKSLRIYEWRANGSILKTIDVPLGLADLRLAKLTGLANSEDFVVQAYGRENKTFWKYHTKSRTLDKAPDTAGINSFRLQPAATWQIDRMGHLFIPVSSANGFHIIKVTIGPLN